MPDFTLTAAGPDTLVKPLNPTAAKTLRKRATDHGLSRFRGDTLVLESRFVPQALAEIERLGFSV